MRLNPKYINKIQFIELRQSIEDYLTINSVLGNDKKDYTMNISLKIKLEKKQK